MIANLYYLIFTIKLNLWLSIPLYLPGLCFAWILSLLFVLRKIEAKDLLLISSQSWAIAQASGLFALNNGLSGAEANFRAFVFVSPWLLYLAIKERKIQLSWVK